METAAPRADIVEHILQHLDAEIADFDPEAVVTGLAIIAFATRTLATAEAHFDRYGLSQGRFSVLMLLFHFPDRTWTPGDLADAAGVRRATMSGLLQTLEKGGWIARRAHPDDGRSRVIEFSETGRDRLAAILPDHFTRIGGALGGIDPEEHSALRLMLRAFGDRLATLDPASGPPDAEGHAG